MREAAYRVIGQRHFDVQLMGGAALHFGWVAEMKTGEGKTLVSTLPAYLNGLTGKGVHLVTVNDYLARRDAEWMGQIHRWMGLAVGLVIPGLPGDARPRSALDYACDITYGTNNEFGFDYLRDNMATSADGQGAAGPRLRHRRRGRLHPHRRGPHPADHLRPGGRRRQALLPVRLRRPLACGATTTTRSTRRSAASSRPRRASSASSGSSAVENLYDAVQQNLVHQLQAALRAKELYKRDKDYIIQDGEVKIVDEFTGRILEGRRWSEGLHQAVEAKEGVKIKEENQTLATITLQNYFRMYDKLAGMTGTATTESAELMNTYDLQVVPIPTNQPVVRADERGPDLQVRAGQVRRRGRRPGRAATRPGQPVLVGTVSVAKSEYLASLLAKRGIPHEVLNAKQHTREAGVVAQAGRLGAVTVATNMAGRGVDIILGGNPEGLARQEVLREGHAARDAGRGVQPAGAAGGDARGVPGGSAGRRRPATWSCCEQFTRRVRGRGRQGPRARRALRARHRAPREPPHRQPAAGPLRPPGRSRREPLLPEPGRRADAALRHRRAAVGDGQDPARRRADRGQDGHQGHRAGAEHRRAAQRRDPQERPQVRRGDERAAQGHLPPPGPDPGRRRPAHGGARVPGRRRADHDRGALRGRGAGGVGPRGPAGRARRPSTPRRSRPSSSASAAARTRCRRS